MVVADVHVKEVVGIVVKRAGGRGRVGHGRGTQRRSVYGGAGAPAVYAAEPALGIVAEVYTLQPTPSTSHLVGVQVFLYQFIAVVVVVFGDVLADAPDGGQEVGAPPRMVVGIGILDAEGTSCAGCAGGMGTGFASGTSGSAIFFVDFERL